MYLYISTEICAFVIGAQLAVAGVWILNRGQKWVGDGWIIVAAFGVCFAMALLVALTVAGGNE